MMCLTRWRTVWIITIAILAVETILFILGADGKPQSWNSPKERKEGEKAGRDWFLVR